MTARPLWPWERPNGRRWLVEADFPLTAQQREMIAVGVKRWLSGADPVAVLAEGLRLREVNVR